VIRDLDLPFAIASMSSYALVFRRSPTRSAIHPPRELA
jgi:hypothetical protein